MSSGAWQAIAEWITAATILFSAAAWAWRQRRTATDWFVQNWRRAMATMLRSEVAAGKAWEAVATAPEVSMEAGIAYARTATQSGHPPYTPTQGRATAEQPLEYLLAKTAETVWSAASAAHQDLDSYLVPVRNYMIALTAKTSLSQARDFALGVLTERVRQEEDGWPDQSGDPAGKRKEHGAGNSHLCLLKTKHEVENALYDIEVPELLQAHTRVQTDVSPVPLRVGSKLDRQLTLTQITQPRHG